MSLDLGIVRDSTLDQPVVWEGFDWENPETMGERPEIYSNDPLTNQIITYCTLPLTESEASKYLGHPWQISNVLMIPE